MDVPDRLRTLFAGILEVEGGKHVIEIPSSEIESGNIAESGTYRIAILDRENSEETDELDTGDDQSAATTQDPSPPVSVGELRTVTIEDLGQQGDGIARVGRGYVIIVPGAVVGDEVQVQITETRESVGFATVAGR